MAKPINITPVLKGNQAVKFYSKLRTNKNKTVSNCKVEQIKKDANALKSIAKF